MPKPVRSQSFTLRKSRRGLRAEAATAALERVRPESHVTPRPAPRTSLPPEVARALRRPFVRTSVSGTSDASELRGISRTQAGAGPGKIVRALNEAGVNNPVLMIDGVDRLVGEGGLGVVEVLLELLDPESSVHFMDHYLELSVDLSHAVMLFCANSLDMVPDSLQERLEVIEVPGYAEDEKLDIARRFLLPRQLHDHGLTPRDLRISHAALRTIVRHYTLEAG